VGILFILEKKLRLYFFSQHLIRLFADDTLHVQYHVTPSNEKRTRKFCKKILIPSLYARNSGPRVIHRNATFWMSPKRKL